MVFPTVSLGLKVKRISSLTDAEVQTHIVFGLCLIKSGKRSVRTFDIYIAQFVIEKYIL